MKTTRMPPASVMDRVGSGVLRSDAGAGNKAVDDGIENGVATWGMNEAASVVAALLFPAIFQAGRDGWAWLNGEGEGSSKTKLLGIGCMPKEVEGGGLEGANTC